MGLTESLRRQRVRLIHALGHGEAREHENHR